MCARRHTRARGIDWPSRNTAALANLNYSSLHTFCNGGRRPRPRGCRRPPFGGAQRGCAFVCGLNRPCLLCRRRPQQQFPRLHTTAAWHFLKVAVWAGGRTWSPFSRRHGRSSSLSRRVAFDRQERRLCVRGPPRRWHDTPVAAVSNATSDSDLPTSFTHPAPPPATSPKALPAASFSTCRRLHLRHRRRRRRHCLPRRRF